ncbi:reverse transcriptase (RNA-dependent DNA polymerase) domain-containing protein [Phthorimaea operculella]|nr:reverse transcriptase (RNA-dependent DNA polymerase) domain-containing protein [Phthorimaea operculella]
MRGGAYSSNNVFRKATSEPNQFYVDANKNANTHPDIITALSYLCKYIDKHVNKLCIEKFSQQHFTKTIKNIKRKHSRDINDMSTYLFDLIPTFIFQIICELFNRCVEVGIYPDSLKQVKVQPIYKGKGEMHQLKSFRPISLIPIFSKVFERLISDKLMSYFNTNLLLNKQQFAYQPGRSTVDAARDVITRVMTHLEGRRQVAAIFCDLSRAFELVSHPLLLAA